MDDLERYVECFKRWEKTINGEYAEWRTMQSSPDSEDRFKDWVVNKLIALFALNERTEWRRREGSHGDNPKCNCKQGEF